MTKIFNLKATVSLQATKIASTYGKGMRSITRVNNRHTMSGASILVCGLLLCLVAQPHSVYASRHLSDTKRYNDGYSNGAQAASTDYTYNPTCDPNGQYTSDGQHTTIYCSGWADGYTATWNANHPTIQTPLVIPSPGISQSAGALGQGQGQGNSNTCINVVNCNPSTTQKQDASGSVKNG